MKAPGSTVRIYAMMESVADWISSEETFQFVSSPDGFYQNELGGPTSRQINSNFFPFVPSLEWDSYVTIGSLYQDGTPFGENGERHRCGLVDVREWWIACRRKWKLVHRA